MFPSLSKINFNFSATFDLLSANAVNLDLSKNLLFGKEIERETHMIHIGQILVTLCKEIFGNSKA